MHSKKNLLSTVIIICICYMFLATVGQAYGFHIDFLSLSERRAPLLIMILFAGLVNIVNNNTIYTNKLIRSGFFLALYMFIVGLFTYSSHYNIGFFVSCSVMWFFMIFITHNIQLTPKQLETRAYILTLFLCAVSVISIIGRMTSQETMQSINSIYYVVTAIPFLFLCNNLTLQAIAFSLSSGAILLSGKSIAFIVWIGVCILFYTNIVRHSKLVSNKGLLNAFFILLALMFGWLFLQPRLTSDGLAGLFSSLFNEIEAGGNGRFEIYAEIFSRFLNAFPLNQLFGHGFYSIENTINSGAHNDFLMVLYNYGLAGLVLYIVFLVQLIKGIKLIRYSNRQYVAAYISSVLIFIVLSMGSNIINAQIQCLLLCVFWGLYSPGKTVLKFY